MENLTKKRNVDLVLICSAYLFIVLHFPLHNLYYEAQMEGSMIYFQTLFRQVGLMAVPLFLMGMGYEGNAKGARAAVALFCLYLFYSVFAALFRYYYLLQGISFTQWINQIFTFQVFPYGDFFAAAIGLCILGPYIRKFVVADDGRKALLALTLIIIIPNFYSFVTGSEVIYWNYVSPLLYYGIGCYIAEKEPKVNRLTLIVPFIVLIAGSAGWEYYMGYSRQFVGVIDNYSSLHTFAATLIVFMWLTRINIGNGVFAASVSYFSKLVPDILLCSFIIEKAIYHNMNMEKGADFQHLYTYSFVAVPVIFALLVIVAYLRRTITHSVSRFLATKDMRLMMKAAGGIGVAVILFFTNSYVIKTADLYFFDNVRYTQNYNKMPEIPNELIGLGFIRRTEIYADNELTTLEQPDFSKDTKKVYHTFTKMRLVNYSGGYLIDMPKNYNLDFSLSPAVTRVYAEGKGEIILSMERAQIYEQGMSKYIEHYLNRFKLNPGYLAANELELKEDRQFVYNDHHMQVITIALNNKGDAEYDQYTYVTINLPEIRNDRTGYERDGRDFFRIMFKYNKGDMDFEKYVKAAYTSFRYFQPEGRKTYVTDYRPIIPDYWTEETRALYDAIKDGKELSWGIFTKDVETTGISTTIPELEEKLGYTFGYVLDYAHLGEAFPLEFMEACAEQGKVVELTYQVTYTNNIELYGRSPMLDIYKGLKDDEIRDFARQAKQFQHPFLFRLNNEMNSDWTSYSGVVNLSDPDIYKEVWRRIYRIFEEEGVNNAIWIWNPNDRNYPPQKWNDFICYYPGDFFVQLFGVTGYNTGDYYEERYGEEWRDFKEIYDDIEYAYMPFFQEFPWIITEFASSSIGGDKVEWIKNMFEEIDNYENIKVAVWFSFADYDDRPESLGVLSRPYFLDETEETLEEFRKGVSQSAAKYAEMQDSQGAGD